MSIHSSRSRGHSSFSHRSSLHRSHNRMSKHHGISNAHAFAVGKSTGVNINVPIDTTIIV